MIEYKAFCKTDDRNIGNINVQPLGEHTDIITARNGKGFFIGGYTSDTIWIRHINNIINEDIAPFCIFNPFPNLRIKGLKIIQTSLNQIFLFYLAQTHTNAPCMLYKIKWSILFESSQTISCGIGVSNMIADDLMCEMLDVGTSGYHNSWYVSYIKNNKSCLYLDQNKEICSAISSQKSQYLNFLATAGHVAQFNIHVAILHDPVITIHTLSNNGLSEIYTFQLPSTKTHGSPILPSKVFGSISSEGIAFFVVSFTHSSCISNAPGIHVFSKSPDDKNWQNKLWNNYLPTTFVRAELNLASALIFSHQLLLVTKIYASQVSYYTTLCADENCDNYCTNYIPPQPFLSYYIPYVVRSNDMLTVYRVTISLSWDHTNNGMLGKYTLLPQNSLYDWVERRTLDILTKYVCDLGYTSMQQDTFTKGLYWASSFNLAKFPYKFCPQQEIIIHSECTANTKSVSLQSAPGLQVTWICPGINLLYMNKLEALASVGTGMYCGIIGSSSFDYSTIQIDQCATVIQQQSPYCFFLAFRKALLLRHSPSDINNVLAVSSALHTTSGVVSNVIIGGNYNDQRKQGIIVAIQWVLKNCLNFNAPASYDILSFTVQESYNKYINRRDLFARVFAGLEQICTRLTHNNYGPLFVISDYNQKIYNDVDMCGITLKDRLFTAAFSQDHYGVVVLCSIGSIAYIPYEWFKGTKESQLTFIHEVTHEVLETTDGPQDDTYGETKCKAWADSVAGSNIPPQDITLVADCLAFVYHQIFLSNDESKHHTMNIANYNEKENNMDTLYNCTFHLQATAIHRIVEVKLTFLNNCCNRRLEIPENTLLFHGLFRNAFQITGPSLIDCQYTRFADDSRSVVVDPSDSISNSIILSERCSFANALPGKYRILFSHFIHAKTKKQTCFECKQDEYMIQLYDDDYILIVDKAPAVLGSSSSGSLLNTDDL
jgi:hypothetical protein